MQSFHLESRLKNWLIDLIQSGNIKEEIRDSDDDDFDDSSKLLENKQGDDSNDHKRLKKNRESAKNSRQRKKIYIDLLEKKVNLG